MKLHIRLAAVIAAILFAGVTGKAANDPRPVVGPGATKDEVINAYGWPNGQSQSGTKEILSYAQGDVILENGRVERVNFSPNVPWQAPKPRPAPPTASTRKAPEVPIDFWLTSFEAAVREAQRRNCRILALFTGSDWSPASRQFRDEAEFHPDFVNAFTGDFVFVKFDFPRGAPVPARISEENLALRDRYSVTTYPTLLVLSSTGELLNGVDLTKADGAMSYRDRVIAAVRAARDGERLAAPAPTAGGATTGAAESASRTVSDVSPDVARTASAMSNAGKLIIAALGAGAAAILILYWVLWRRPRTVVPKVEVREMADRIDAAAGGMPTLAEISRWPKERLTAVTAALAEFDSYVSRVRRAGGDVDIELRRRGDVSPRVLVVCSPGSSGVVGTKRLRELFASLAAEGVENGWFVSPAGFAADAGEYAAAHRILLVSADGIQGMMREVPPVSLPGVLART